MQAWSIGAFLKVMNHIVLDVGCGSNPKGDVNVDLFLDPTHRAGETVSLKPKNIKNFVLADAHFLPFRNDTFTLVYSSHLLEHCLNPYQVLQEFKRVSKLTVYLEVPYMPRNPNDCPHHLYSWDSHSLEHLLKKVFPHVKIYCTERIAHNLRQHRPPRNLVGDLLLMLIRFFRHNILWRKQLSAVCHKIPAKIVYTVSDREKLVSNVIKSIKSLRKFVNKENILIYYTPPRTKRNLKKLSKLATVIEAPNVTKPFVFNKERGLGRYGEKVHLCDVNCPNVIFLDADTVVKKNPLNLLNGNYDLSARAGQPLNKTMNQKIWKQMCAEYGKKPIPIPNTGFLIFKNYCHKHIREEWLKFLNDDNLPNPHPRNNLKDQYALALAVSGKQIKRMTSHQHTFRWLNEEKVDTYVLHGTKKPLRKLKRLIKKLSSPILTFHVFNGKVYFKKFFKMRG